MITALLVTVMVLLVLLLVSFWVVVYHLIRQQGRLVLRLDDVESRIGMRANSAQAPAGLPVGTAIEPFELPDLEGKPVSLETFKDKRMLLVHWSPNCGFCDFIASDLAELLPDLKSRNVELVMVAHGDAEANRKMAEEHGLKCPILLLGQRSMEAFENTGTPVAYLLDAKGQTVSPLAIGADQVLDLVQEAAAGPKRKRLPGERSLSESRIERSGLKAGTPAPNFSLPDINGKTVSLEDYRGKKVLLIFTDPHCGPCDALAKELVRVQEKASREGLALIMVGRGDPVANRRKVEEQGLRFPVVLQKKWEVSKEFGIFGTPVGFLIDENGIVSDEVAQGVDRILQLGRNGLTGKRDVLSGEVRNGRAF